MDTSAWLVVLASAVGGILLMWAALMVALWTHRPDAMGVREALRLLPDLIRMLRRIAADPDVPRGVRVRLWLLLGYLLMPIDLVPDFIPVIGYADDAVIVALALRSVTRRAGPEALERHWPGTPEGLAALRRLAGATTPRPTL
ncbi:MAG: YkvA family protein [Geodermatophilaceae bacterium]